MAAFDPLFSFGIVSSKGFLEKLTEEYKDFDNNHVSARYAMNCALTSWHLTDWTYSEFFKEDERFQDTEKTKTKQGKEYLFVVSGLGKYQDYLIKRCEELKYMRLIANGSKHCILRGSTIREKTVLYQGDFSHEEFNRHEFSVDRFEIALDDATTIDFEDVLLKTIDFWRAYLVECELISNESPNS
ncbi:MAG: hypothetical protein JWR44_3701 [Hymenobacter sp.]|jgi:hypothetical protein|nr:hypothetical protein [Hymenobacter sp.]